MEEVEGSQAAKNSKTDSSPPHQRANVKLDVCEEIFRRLKESGSNAVNLPGFAEELQGHFNRLPTRYALDVNTERAEDVLTHKKLLEQAKAPENRPAFHVRPVHVLPLASSEAGGSSSGSLEDSSSPLSSPQDNVASFAGRPVPRVSSHPPPSFGSSPNLEALALDLGNKPIRVDEGKDVTGDPASPSISYPHMPMHEVTFSTIDKPKLLSQLSAVLAELGLNIREAHVFCTADGYSLDVFIVDGWPTEDTQLLEQELERVLSALEEGAWSKAVLPGPKLTPPPPEARQLENTSSDWEIDSAQLICSQKIAAGAFGDLFRGTYCGQDVAIKILKPDRLNENLQSEFQQEISIMRKVRHKNVVQFIGACTKLPNLCIVTEYMAGGSVYDFIHKNKTVLKLATILRIAVDVSKGMDYLHQNNIIHRDLKAANLLMDENEVVKVADFGVARVQSQSGIMTAETGTYRWMAPEVIEHKRYDRKVDVFSFAIVLWELLTGKLPYAYLTPLQAAVAVVQHGLRPTIPKHTHPKLAELLDRCWRSDPSQRPDFSEVTVTLQDLLKEAVKLEQDMPKHGDKKGFLAALKRNR